MSPLSFFSPVSFLFIYLFIYWLHWVFVAAHRLSLLVVSRGYSSLQCMGFSLWWLLLLPSMGSRCMGFSSCGRGAQQLWHLGCRVQAQQLWHPGFVAPQYVGSSWTRARARVLCVGRWTLNHCATREVLPLSFLILVICVFCLFIETGQGVIDFIDPFKELAFGFVYYLLIFCFQFH